ncbi:hypothetical protein PAHAL_8G186600 [Panicum hallii]|uniref:Transport inhibitor response 1 domain-containing protein n=1 Tax=Panicum hallii TaxID=206008 RepID=A0A2S3IEE0_9POAL|nr:hypothetical protein PAHAL_8G186600 [Panicum hallii]
MWFLKELDLQESVVKHRGHHWLNCFPKPSTELESLNFACLSGEVNASALEGLVARSPNLKRLRLNRRVPFDVWYRILGRTPKLEDLGFWAVTGFYLRGIFSVCKNLTCLNLSCAPLIQSADLINIIRRCTKLHVLWLLDHIGDEGLKVVGFSCPDLQELRVFRNNADAATLTEEGLVAISSGCRKLQSVLYFCNRMTNAALFTIAKNCPQLTSFRLCIVELSSADAMTGQPLDEGFGAIVQSCKGLRRLSMSGLLTDCVFLYIGMYAEKLEMLSVAFVGGSDDGMVYVLNGCKNLKKLEIRDSPFGDTALLAGVDRYEAMRSLWMSSCNITLGGCKTLAASMPGVNVEVISRAGASIDEADEASSNAKKVEKLYLYRTIAGPRGDAPGFVSLL